MEALTDGIFGFGMTLLAVGLVIPVISALAIAIAAAGFTLSTAAYLLIPVVLRFFPATAAAD